MRKRPVLICISLVLFGLLQGCGLAEPPAEVLTATARAIEIQGTQQALAETQTAVAKIPTDTPIPDTPTPTETEVPSATPTDTEIPDTPTNTPVPPTNTSVPPTKAPESQDTGDTGGSGEQATGGTLSCNQQSSGAVKIRVENLTDGPISLYFYGAENYACSISQGVAKIYLKSGSYSMSALMCGGNYSLGTYSVSPSRYFQLKCP